MLLTSRGTADFFFDTQNDSLEHQLKLKIFATFVGNILLVAVVSTSNS